MSELRSFKVEGKTDALTFCENKETPTAMINADK